jgi:hypothetical protein
MITRTIADVFSKFEGSYSSVNCKKLEGGMVEKEETSYLDYTATHKPLSPISVMSVAAKNDVNEEETHYSDYPASCKPLSPLSVLYVWCREAA